MLADASVDHLLFFTRFPTPGVVKSRLAAEIGAAAATAAHDVMARYCLAAAQSASLAMGASLRVLITGANAEAAADWLGSGHCFVDQGEGDLGERFHRAVKACIDQGARRVIVMGADCPALSPALIADAFARLNDNDVVLGPTVDGGFYLFGLAERSADQFTALIADLPWGTDAARAAVERNAWRAGARLKLLPMQVDIDTLADIDPVRWPWLSAAMRLSRTNGTP